MTVDSSHTKLGTICLKWKTCSGNSQEIFQFPQEWRHKWRIGEVFSILLFLQGRSIHYSVYARLFSCLPCISCCSFSLWSVCMREKWSNHLETSDAAFKLRDVLQLPNSWPLRWLPVGQYPAKKVPNQFAIRFPVFGTFSVLIHTEWYEGAFRWTFDKGACTFE